MHKHRKQADGVLRDSDNWQNGIPKDAYIKSAWRHFMDWWMEHRGLQSREGLEDALMGLLFNVMGYAHEVLTDSTIPRAARQPTTAVVVGLEGTQAPKRSECGSDCCVPSV
jgi:hypothetical protein